VEPEGEDLHAHLGTVDEPLNSLTEAELCPGAAVLERINASLR
jgi:2-oxoglutarate ferredoxin oxidoreductase subunit beta